MTSTVTIYVDTGSTDNIPHVWVELTNSDAGWSQEFGYAPADGYGQSPYAPAKKVEKAIAFRIRVR